VRKDPFLVLALGAHVVVTLSALWMVAAAALSISTRSVLGAVLAGFLLPGLATLAADRRARFVAVALVLVVVIGTAIVELVVSGVAMPAVALLGAAMLEFAALLSLSRRPPRREPSEPAQP